MTTAMNCDDSRHFQRVRQWGAACAIFLCVIAAPTDVQAQRRAAMMVFAQEAPPPTLDPYFSTSVSTRNVAMHIFETLVTRDENNAIVPELADKITESPDGLSYTFTLRRGIKFHNGQVMTSADVKASFERYQKVALQKVILAPVSAIETPDAHTVILRLSHKVPVFLDEMSSFVTPLAILPASQRDREGGKIDMIGTGPLQFVEWQADSHVRLKRFADYVPDARYKGTDGFAGRKEIFFEQVDFKLVKDPGARVAGLEAGQFHIIEDLPIESAKRLAGNRALTMYNLNNWWLHGAWVNHSKAPTNDNRVRRALQIALDMEEIMEIATDGAYVLQPGLQYPGNPYCVTAGAQFYNKKDPAAARKLLAEAGYKGEEIVIITNSSYQTMFKAAQVVAEQLKGVGFKVRVDVFDWATALARRRDGNAWNLWFTGQGTGPSVGPFAAMKDVVSPQKNQITADPVIDTLYGELITGATVDARKATFAKFQERVYDQVLFLKFGDLTRKQASRANVKGFIPYRIPRLWNVRIED